MWLSRRLRLVNSGACENIPRGILVTWLCSMLRACTEGEGGEGGGAKRRKNRMTKEKCNRLVSDLKYLLENTIGKLRTER